MKEISFTKVKNGDIFLCYAYKETSGERKMYKAMSDAIYVGNSLQAICLTDRDKYPRETTYSNEEIVFLLDEEDIDLWILKE